MDEYTVTFARSARKELEKLDAFVSRRILPRIESLQQTARPQGCRKLRGAKDLWRIRIGDYRVIYTIDDRNKIVDINAVRHRKDAYS